MGQLEKNLFNARDVAELKSQHFIEDVAPLEANQFQGAIKCCGYTSFQNRFFFRND